MMTRVSLYISLYLILRQKEYLYSTDESSQDSNKIKFCSKIWKKVTVKPYFYILHVRNWKAADKFNLLKSLQQ